MKMEDYGKDKELQLNSGKLLGKTNNFSQPLLIKFEIYPSPHF
jgi:hypothetical protein